MSRQNVELLHRALDAFNRRDLEAFLALMEADVEAVSRLVAIEGDYRGHDGIRRWWGNLLDAIPDFTIEVVEVRDLGDLTLAVLRNRGHGAGSEIPVEQRLWHVAEWRDQKVVWWSAYETEAEALEAVGLRESLGR
jgi:ketosteroid isomerase-like protein